MTYPYFPIQGIGLDFEVRLSQATTSSLFGMIVLGTSSSNWLGVPLPADLGVVGAPGCQLFTNLELLQIIPVNNGSGAMTWTLPVQPSAVGAQLFAQGATFDPAAPVSLLVDMSAAMAFVIGSP